MVYQPPTVWNKRATELKGKPRPVTSEGVNKFDAARRAASQSEGSGDVLANKFERNRIKTQPVAAQSEQEILGNAFDRDAAKKGNPIASKNRTGMIEDDKLRAAREAEEARKAAINAPTRQPSPFPYSSAEDWAAILISWRKRASPPFVATKFNGENLARMLDHQCNIGQLRWDSAGLQACHVWLAENNFYESAPGQRKRGTEPPKTYPVYEPAALKPDNSIVTKHRTVVTQEEVTNLRSEDFDSLAVRARSTNKERDPRKTISHI